MTKARLRLMSEISGS